MPSRSRSPKPRALKPLIALVAAMLGACGSLPTAGPTVRQVLDQQAEGGKTRFVVVDINDRAAAAAASAHAATFGQRFGTLTRPPELRIAVGDSVNVSIWEAASGGLFSASTTDQVGTGSRSVALPEQVVGGDGAITVPFAGRVPAAGHTPVEVQHAIERRLRGKAIDPQVIVAVSKGGGNTVTVAGDAVGGALIPLSPKGDRLLDLIAAAGGAKTPVYETFVRLSRHGVTATIPMEALVSDPAQNIFAEPGDVLTVVRRPQTFTVFGAAGKNTEVSFKAAKLTLVEALARAGGLQDMRSDPAGVFLMRYESPAVMAALGRLQPDGGSGAGGMVPVVYRLDLSDAEAYFAAERFPIRDKDILYVANADLNELQKFFNLLNTLTAPVITGIVLKNASP